MHDAFARCLNARLSWLTYRVLCTLPGGAEEAKRWKEDALFEVFEVAESEAWASQPRYGKCVPPLFADVEELAADYRKYFDMTVIERDQHAELEGRLRAEFELKQEQEIIKAAETERVDRLIQSGRWDELGLPTPQQMFTELMEGKGQHVESHFVDFDAEDGLTYLDNPYGVTLGLCGVPDLNVCARFLANMARGHVYGPVPPGYE